MSTDDTLSWPDPGLPPPTDQAVVITWEVSPLQAGQCETRALTATAAPPGPHANGTYYLGVIADVQQSLVELDESNNIAVTAMRIGNLPDLVVTELRGPASTTGSGELTSTLEVCNQGTAPSALAYVEVYFSTKDTLSRPDYSQPLPSELAYLGTVEVGALQPSHCARRQSAFPLVLPPGAAPGQPLYLGAIATAVDALPELDEDNNISVSDLIALGHAPDLVVTSVLAPANVRSGAHFHTAVRVCNQGTMPADPSSLELYLSLDGNVSGTGTGTPPPGQVMVGQALAPRLSPGHCQTLDVLGSATPPSGAPLNGAVFLAAIVDATQGTPELSEDNNVYLRGLIGVGEQPDLVITAIRAPTNLSSSPSGTTVSVTVCNEGTTHASDVDVELYLSMTSTVDPHLGGPSVTGAQASIGGLSLAGLDAGRCATRDVSVHSNRPLDAHPSFIKSFYLGAIVDAGANIQELREDNNTFVGERVGVGHGPDLLITSVKGPTSILLQDFPLTARVCNQGSEPAPSTQLEFYLASNALLNAPVPGGTLPDPLTAIPVVMIDVPALNESECRTLSTLAQTPFFPVWPVKAPYYLSASVDPGATVQELREDNNTLIGDLMGVGSNPDLVVTAITAPASVRWQEPISPTLTICNQGTMVSAPSVAQVFLSTEPNLVMPNWNGPGDPLPWSQNPAGELDVPALHVGRCFTGRASGPVHLPSTAFGRALYLGAIIDAEDSIEELREDNNAFVHGRIGAGDRADLVVTAIAHPTSAQLHASFTAAVTVCNQGTEHAGFAEVELYFSTQATLELPRWDGPGSPLPDTQHPAGYMAVQHLDAGQCITQPIQSTAQRPPAATPGQPLYLGAIIDAGDNVDELREDNNTFVSGLMGMGSAPDLVITAVQAPANVMPNATFSATVTVCNQGTHPSDNTSVEIHLSTEAELVMPRWNGTGTPLPATQHPVGTMSVPSLDSGRCFTGSAVATAVRPGTEPPDQPLYLGVLVDGNQSEQELREDNNIYSSGRFVVSHGPDLIVTSITGPASVSLNSAFTATVSVCNQGTEEAPPTQVEVHFSTEANMVMPSDHTTGIPLPDSQLRMGYNTVPALQVDECITVDVPTWGAQPPAAAQPNQPLYLGAAVYTYDQSPELREDNNTFVGDLIGVGNAPDLVITAVQGPASVSLNGNFTASVTVCNQGTQNSNSVQLDLYFSTRAQVMMPQWNTPGVPYPRTQEFIGAWNVQPLNPGQCITEPVPAWVDLPEEAEPHHPLYLGAIIDSNQMQAELREDNNIFVSGLMGVGNRPDLVVTSVSGPTSVRMGSSFTATVRVCNQGTTPTHGSMDVTLYLSSSNTLEFPYQSWPGAPPDSQSQIGVMTVHSLDAGQCVTRNTQVTANTPPDSGPTGLFYLGALVDPWQNLEELREDNNVLADRFIAVMP